MPKRHICLSRMALLPLIALAAPPALAECLSFEEAMQLSANLDPGVEAARAEQREAAADLKDARSLNRPQVAGFGRTGLGDVGADNSVVQNQFGLRASQRIYDFGDARLARQAAQSRELAGAESVRQEQLLAAQETALAYLDHLEADAQLAATHARRAYFEDLLHAVETLLERGGATRAEQADIAARLAEAEAATLELRFLKDEAATRIHIATGLDLPVCEAPSADAVLEPGIAMLATMEDAVTEALFSSPHVKELERRADSFDATRQREQRARLPIIEVVGIASYASTGSSGAYDVQERIGIDVSIPLYSGSALTARSERAEARGALASADAAIARRQLRQDVSITFQRMLSLEGQLLSRRTVERYKQSEVEAAMLEFDRGVRTLRDLIEVRLDYEDATLQRIGTEFELRRRKVELLALTARLPGLEQG